MSTIMIRAKKQDNKIMSEIAKKPGYDVIDIKDDEFEDLMLGKWMDSVKTGKTVSRTAIFKKLRSK